MDKKRLLILYSTFTFNTQDAANFLAEKLKLQRPEWQIDVMDTSDFSLELFKNYDKVIFGCSTWDEDHSSSTYELLDKLEAEKPDLSFLQIAVFGLGDSSWPKFCESAKVMAKEFTKYKAKVYSDIHTIDGYPVDNEVEELTSWAESFLENN